MKNIYNFLLLLCLTLSVTISSAQPWAASIQKAEPTFYDLQDAFNEYYETHIHDWEADDEWMHFKRWEAFTEPRVYPTGKPIDPAATWEALQEEQMKAKKNSGTMAALGANWKSLGPGTINTLTGSGLGRVNCISFLANDTNTMWAGTSGGGIWRSTNGGNSWTEFNNNLPTLSIADIAIDPSNSNILYAATGDPFGYGAFNNNSIFWGGTYSSGVMKSTNGGSSWSNTGMSYSVASKNIIHRLIIDPLDPSILFAAASNGIWRTSDGGDNWTKVKKGYVDDIEFNASNPDILYATIDSIFTSTDGGITWSSMPGAPVLQGRVSIETTPADSNYIYILQESSLFFRSTDGGTTWKKMNDITAAMYGYYDCVLAVSPTNKDMVVCGGIWACRSFDGGNKWIDIVSGVLHVDNHAFEFLPNGTSIYCGNDGGVYKSTNSGYSWTNLSKGLVITQFYRMGSSASNAGIIYAGAQDNGTGKYSSGSWKGVWGADGMECLVDYTNSNIVYISIQNGVFYKSTDGGNSFSSISPVNGAWTTPLIMHPQNPKTLFTGSDEIKKSTNGGTSWTNISSGVTNGGQLISLAISPTNPNYIYAATYIGIFRTTNGGTSWNNITSSLPVNANAMTYIAVGGIDPDKVWVTFSGYNSGEKAYRSINGGTTWSNVSGSLPNVPVNCITYDNLSLNDAVYAGTDIGVYYMDNNTGNWQPYNTGMPAVIIDELELHYGSSTIRAATYGRGLWESPLSITTATGKLTQVRETISLYPNPGKGKFYIDVNGNENTDLNIKVFNLVGEEILALRHNVNMSAKVSFDLSNQPEGIYFVEMTAGFETRTEKIVVIR